MLIANQFLRRLETATRLRVVASTLDSETLERVGLHMELEKGG